MGYKNKHEKSSKRAKRIQLKIAENVKNFPNSKLVNISHTNLKKTFSKKKYRYGKRHNQSMIYSTKTNFIKSNIDSLKSLHPSDISLSHDNSSK
jgi:hypothetical protein